MAGEGRELVERFYQAFNDGDLDVVEDVFDPNVQTTEPQAGVLHDYASFRAYMQMFKGMSPDAKLNVDNIAESGESVVVDGRFTGTFTNAMPGPQGEIQPTGKEFELPYRDIFEIRGGRIVEHRVEYDPTQFMVELGVGPNPEVDRNEGGYDREGGATS